MALLGVAFALGAGEVMAQVDATLTVTTERSVVEENGNRLPVTVRLSVPRSSPVRTTDQTVTVTLTLTRAGGSGQSTISASRLAELPSSTALDGDDLTWANAPGGAADSDTLTLTFTVDPGNFSDERTVDLGINEDDDAEDEHFYIDGSSAAVTGVINADNISRHVSIRIDDDETQSYVLLPDNHPRDDREIEEGEELPLLFEARPPHTTNRSLRVVLSSDHDDSDYTLGGNDSNTQVVTLPGERDPGDTTGATAQATGTPGELPLTLESRSNDRDRQDDTVTVDVQHQANGNRVGAGFKPLVITVLDQHKLPAISRAEGIESTDGTTKSMVTMLKEGQEGTVKLLADRTGDGVPNDEDITVELGLGEGGTADARDYRLDSSKVELKGTATSGTFVLDVLPDEEVGDETLVLMAKVSGEDNTYGPSEGVENSEVMLDAITLTDGTVKKIEPKLQAMVDAAVASARDDGDADGDGLWTPGEMLSLDADDLFSWPMTTTSVVLGNVQVSDAKVVSAGTTNDMLTVEAEAAGMATVTVTATVTGESSAILQTVSNVAQVEFDIVVDAPAITAMPQAAIDTAVAAAIMEAADKAASKQWEPGGAMAMVPLDKLFDVPDSIDPVYAAESSDEGDVMAAISGGMYVSLTPMSAGTAMITVSAVDTEASTTTVVSFDATVMAQAALRALSQAEVDKVFEDAGADDLVAQGPAISLDMSDLFEVGPNVTPSYSAGSSDADVLRASASGAMLTLTPGQGVDGGSATITVTALDSDSGVNDSVEYMAMVDKLPAMLTITSMPMSGAAVEEGGTITVTATLNQEAPHDKSIKLQISGSATGPDELMLETGEMSASAELTVNDDDAVMAMPDIVVVASHEAIASGSAVLSFSVTENDEEPEPTNLVTAKASAEIEAVLVAAGLGDDAMFNSGASAMVDASMLFDAVEGANVT
ncbi:MAG: hypothetical protein OXG42_06740, partial [Chloroflexi bacterium]|nr:hypothetical protein [Chloroflexota bacterium]